MLWPKKNSHKEFDNEKCTCGSKIPLPPHIVSNGRPLVHSFSLYCLLLLVRSPPTYGVRHLSIA